jgi:putative transcriptional regulator
MLDYATGALGPSQSLVVAAHFALNAAARAAYADLDAIGGVLLEALDHAGGVSRPANIAATPGHARDPGLPHLVRRALALDVAGMRWRERLPGMQQVAIDGYPGAALMRIRAGRPAPRHGHTGEELTLVIDGEFRDDTGVYRRGDLAIADGDDEHRPAAGPDRDCICLIAMTGGYRFQTALGWLAARFLQ